MSYMGAMKMRSTFLQNQPGLGHRLADCSVAGFGSIFWILNRIFLTPRSVRIGLSGLLIWVGAVGACLADSTPKLGQTWRVLGAPSATQSGAIKDPFHPQGYLLELADKMGPSKPGNAVLGARNLQTPRPIAPTPAPARPTLGVTWLSPGNQAPRQSVTSQPIMSPPAWLSSTHQPTPKGASSDSSLGQVRWLSPSDPSLPAPTAPATGTASTKETIRDPLPPAPIRGHTTWLPSGPPAAKTPVSATPAPQETVNAAPPMSHANWLPSGNSTPRTVTSVNAAIPTSHATWLPSSSPAPQKPAVDETAWPAPEKHFAHKPATSQPAKNATTWLSPENGAAQQALKKMAALKARSLETETPLPEHTAVDPAPAVVAKQTPQVKPRQLTMPRQTAAPQMPLLPKESVPARAASPISSPVMYAAMDMSQAKHFFADPSEPAWSLGADLDKYRNHAVQEGARHSGQSLQNALGRIGLIVEDTTNVITLGYASDRAVQFRKNDGKGLIDDPTRVPKQAGDTVVNLGDGLYSIADLITLNALPDHDKNVYQDNHPLVRPLVFTGRTIGGAWKTTEEIGNAVTWGYFDNVTGSIGMCIEDLIEILKHAGQAVTNLARVPVQLIAGKNKADKALDWVLLVPLEFASNVLEMKGISNMDDYETAFADKGVIGSILEFGGSTFIVYRTLDELVDELKDDDHRSSNNQPGEEPTPEPTKPPVTPPEPPIPTVPSDWGVFIWSDGQVWTGGISG